ncbi:hypothetical protein AKO1_008550 [Acrasis kona]|uniref:Ion transport domain-containing protein n=1 Tax=Acrasis kona TaxID=1008807 RepID=A0AAW2YMA7_9EUKA
MNQYENDTWEMSNRNTVDELAIHTDSRHRQFQKKLYNVLEDPSTSWWAKIYTITSYIFVVTSLVLLILDSYAYIQREDEFLVLDAIITAFFTLEYILRFYASSTTLKSALMFVINPLNIADFLSIVPFYILIILNYGFKLNHTVPNLDTFRILRLFRLLKLTQHSQSIKLLTKSIRKSYKSLLTVIYFMFVIVLVTGTLMYYIERGTLNQEESAFILPDGTLSVFSSIPAGMWWSIVTLVTLGYGDLVPRTVFGKLLASCTMILGVMILAMPSMIIGAAFTKLVSKKKNQKKIDDRNVDQESNNLQTLLNKQEELMVNFRNIVVEMENNHKLIRSLTNQSL